VPQRASLIDMAIRRPGFPPVATPGAELARRLGWQSPGEAGASDTLHPKVARWLTVSFPSETAEARQRVLELLGRTLEDPLWASYAQRKLLEHAQEVGGIAAVQRTLFDRRQLRVLLDGDRDALLMQITPLAKKNKPLAEVMRRLQAQAAADWLVDFARQPLAPDRPWTGKLGLDAAWSAGMNGAGVRVAILSTGIDAAHPELQHLRLTGATNDVHGHGTAVASVVAGCFIGIAPGVSVHSVSPMNAKGTGSTSSFVKAIDSLLEAPPEQRADIVCLPFGSAAPDQAMEVALKRLIDADMLLIAAAGNDGRDHPSFPSSIPHVLSVGGMLESGEPATYSNRGADLYVAADEVLVAKRTTPQTEGSDLYEGQRGTSFACAAVAAIAALHAQATGLRGKALAEMLLRAATEDRRARFDVGLVRTNAEASSADLGPSDSPNPIPGDTGIGTPLLRTPFDIGISLSSADDGYDCVVWGAVAARARLKLQPSFLASAIESLRREVMKVVMHQDSDGAYVFQTGIDIGPESQDFALAGMARAGALLFQKMFFGPNAGDDSKAVGNNLREWVSDPTKRLNLQVVTDGVPIPWTILYTGDASAGAKLDWNLFIGMNSWIDEVPLQTNLTVTGSEIASDQPRLAVSLNVNTQIDAQLGLTVVADQSAFWAQAAKRGRIALTTRTTSVEVLRALADTATDDQIMYIFCHAEASGLSDPGGPDASSLVFSDTKITLADLFLDASTTTLLHGQPLVFMNTGGGAFRAFAPYFFAKGARGVVGPQFQVPVLFAVEWARRFFERFLAGAALGEVFLALRREFLELHGNPLGLFYAGYCDGDTKVKPSML